jgi:hypothetical protein
MQIDLQLPLAITEITHSTKITQGTTSTQGTKITEGAKTSRGVGYVVEQQRKLSTQI